MRESAQDSGHSASRHFSSYLRRCRLARHLSLRQVEELSEGYADRVSNSYLAYCETGRLLPSLGKLITLSRILGVPLQNFIELVELDHKAVEPPILDASADWGQMRRTGIAEAESGNLKLSLAYLEGALSLAAGLPPAEKDGARADLRMDIAIVLKRMSHHYTARDLLEEVLSKVKSDAPRADRALILLAGVLREMGRLPIAAMVGQEAMRRAKKTGDDIKEAHAASLVGTVFFDLGDAEKATPLYERAVQIFRRGDDRASLTCVLASLGNCHVQRGRFTEGIKLLQDAELLAQGEGFKRQVADILGYLGQACVRQGNFPAAEKHFYRSNQIARQGEYYDVLFYNSWHLRELALKTGRDEEAAALLRSLRYFRTRVENGTPEIKAFDRLAKSRESSEEEEGGVAPA